MSEGRKICVLVATHKEYRMPVDEMYLPIYLGAEGKENENVDDISFGYIKDNTGDNISEKNLSFCELTGLYWGWKNLDCDYLGLTHYRRHFVYERKSKDVFENVLNHKEANELLDAYPIIVPKKRRYYIESLYSHYAHTHYAEHLDKTREILERKYPEFISSFDNTINRRAGYMFNMMIMRKDLLDSYCSWLFDILFELEKVKFDCELSQFQGRFYGRVSEIMFNVWLDYQIENKNIIRESICELPCVYMEKIDWLRKITSFLKAKFFSKKYEGSF